MHIMRITGTVALTLHECGGFFSPPRWSAAVERERGEEEDGGFNKQIANRSLEK